MAGAGVHQRAVVVKQGLGGPGAPKGLLVPLNVLQYMQYMRHVWYMQSGNVGRADRGVRLVPATATCSHTTPITATIPASPASPSPHPLTCSLKMAGGARSWVARMLKSSAQMQASISQGT